MARLPKSIIKKYGISKKAWSVFRKQKTKSRGYSMAKRKRFGGKKGKGFLGKALNVLVGAGVAALYEVFISPRIPLARNIKNIIEMVVGIILMFMPKLPMFVRAGGAALATINAFEILVPLISSIGNGSGSGQSMANM
jgi:hypothetical protein